MTKNYVFFGKELNQRAPELFGHICTAPLTEWVGLLDIGEALLEGHSISIRHATESEMKRAEGLIALRNVGEEMARRIHQLLDDREPTVVTAALTSLRDAIESADTSCAPIHLLDQ